MGGPSLPHGPPWTLLGELGCPNRRNLEAFQDPKCQLRFHMETAGVDDLKETPVAGHTDTEWTKGPERVDFHTVLRRMAARHSAKKGVDDILRPLFADAPRTPPAAQSMDRVLPGIDLTERP